MNRKVDRDPNPTRAGPYPFGKSVSKSPVGEISVGVEG